MLVRVVKVCGKGIIANISKVRQEAPRFVSPLGCLLGFQLIPRDANAPQNGKTKFNEDNEKTLSVWMEDNLLLFFYANDEYTAVEKELIKAYNPPLNLQGNFYRINSEFRKVLSSLRTQLNSQATPFYCCPICGNSINNTEILKGKKDIKCPSCGDIFRNPFYEQMRRKKEAIQWKYVFIVVCVSFVLYWMSELTNTSDYNSNEYIGDKKELKYTQAIAGVRYYLKHKYLKDPDSYEGIEWGAFGSYNKDTYFALHKYRAKNSFGGYVVEEKVFVLDKEGNVLKVVDDAYDMIND